LDKYVKISVPPRGKITFETSKTTSNVVLLRSYVVFGLRGRVYGVMGNAFFEKRGSASCFVWRSYICGAGE
jgi:hypothetical protein